MRIIKAATLTEYCKQKKYHQAEDALKAWVYEVRFSSWKSANELKVKYGNASIINSKRVVFNVKAMTTV